MKRFLVLLLIFPFLLFAKENRLAKENRRIVKEDNQIIVDINFSPYCGAEDLLTLHHFLIKGEDRLLKRPPFKKSFLAGMGRFGELLCWDILDSYLMITQHEIFGHGYRIRDLGPHYAHVIGYSFKWNGAVTSYDITENLTTSQECAISIAGVEASAILASRMKMKLLERGKIDGREASLYINSQQDITNYVFSLEKKPLEPTPGGHDINNYLYFLQATYHNGSLTKKKLKSMAFVTLLDPFTYYSLCAWFKFIIDGEKFDIPMIPIGKCSYLFAFRLGLAPFGPEFFLENYLVDAQKRPIYFYLKGSKYAGNGYLGAGVEQPFMYKNDEGFSLGYRLDVFYQPKVIFKKGVLQVYELESEEDYRPVSTLPPIYTSATLHKKRLGAALSLIFEKEIKKSGCLIYFEPGFKSKGFLPGQALRSGIIARGGLSFRY